MVSHGIFSEPLLSRPWTPVDLGGSEFLCKSWFGQTQYHILLMDRTSLWEEMMEADAIQDRAQGLNRRLRASIQSFFAHLVAVVEPYLTESGWGQSEAQVTLQRWDGHMALKLKSELAGLPFYWEFHCNPAPATTACVQLVRPLLAMSGALQCQVELLGKLLQRKDAEIQDYRENGAQLTRERLQTETFEEDAFREDFMAKTLPLLLNQTSLSFDLGLQRLYSCIVSQRNTTKRKRPEGEDSKQDGEEASTLEQNHTQGDGSAAVEPKQKEVEKSETTPQAKKTTQPTMQQSVPCATQKPASKPKKKKVGLFR